MKSSLWYRIGDVIAGAVLGAGVAAIENAIGAESMFWPLRFAFMMLVAMGVQAVFGLLFGAFLGNVEIAVPGFMTAMVAMFIPEFTNDLLQQVALGALLGANIFAAFELWDMKLHGRQLQRLERKHRTWRMPGKLRSGWYDFRQHGGNRRRAWIQRQLLSEAQGDVLVAGAGTGLNLAHLSGRNDLRITAVDMDDDFLAKAKERGFRLGLTVHCVVGDLEDLALQEDTFDTVVSIATLCSVASPKIALAEYRRVLRPGGRLLLFEHVRSNTPVIGTLMSVMDQMQSRANSSIARQTLDEVRNAGFTVTSVVSGFADVYLAITAVNPDDRMRQPIPLESRPELRAAVSCDEAFADSNSPEGAQAAISEE